MNTKSILRSKELNYESEHRRFEDSQNQAARADAQLDGWDRKLQDIRQTIKETQDLIQQYKDTIGAEETSISITSKTIQQVNAKSKEIDTELWTINQKIANTQSNLKKLRSEADISKMKALSAAERTLQIQTLMAEEQQKLEELTKLIEKEMRTKSYWLTKKAHLASEAINTDHAISSNEKNFSKLQAQIKEDQWIVRLLK